MADDHELSGYEDRINHSVVEARREPRRRECPGCGGRGHAHERDVRKACHLPVKGVPLVTLPGVVRFKCPGCGKTRYDDYSDLIGSLPQRMTADLEFAITMDLIGKTGVAAVSRKEGPSEEPATKVPGAAIPRCDRLPHTPCTGELAAHTEKGRLSAAVARGGRGCLVETLERPRGDVLGDFFSGFPDKERARAGFFVCDMPGAFISAKELWFPRAKLRVDGLHAAREAAAAPDEARARAAGPEETGGEGNPTRWGKPAAREKKETERARRRPRMRRPGPGRGAEPGGRRDRPRGQLPGTGPRDPAGLTPRPEAPERGPAGRSSPGGAAGPRPPTSRRGAPARGPA